MVDTSLNIWSTIFLPKKQILLFILDSIKPFTIMTMKFTIAFLATIFSTGLFAQSLTDAVRYSDLQAIGTARTAGVAGSFGAMGGDFGSLVINPAGMGDFRKSELNFGFAFNNIQNETSLVRPEYLGDGLFSGPISINDVNLNIGNIGFIVHRRPTGSVLQTSNFSVGVNQLKNFSEEFQWGTVTHGSITERFTEVANGNDLDDLDPFEGGVAYDAGAIFESNNPLAVFVYQSDLPDSTTLVNKSQFVERSGNMNELSFGWAGNIANVVNIGVSGSVPFVSFEEYKTYNEELGEAPQGNVNFDRLEYIEVLSTTGVGLNFKAGATARLGKIVRVGVAYHSPSWLRLQDDYSTELEYTFIEDGVANNNSAESPDGRFDYILKTTGKLVASAGALLNFGEVKGFVNADAEFENFQGANFDFTLRDSSPSTLEFQREVNADIDGELTNALTLRIGGELAYKKLRVRMGVQGEGSPYLIDNKSFIRRTFSAGLGYRGDRFYIDGAAYVFSDDEGYYPYLVLTDGRNQLVSKQQNTLRAMITFGYKI